MIGKRKAETQVETRDYTFILIYGGASALDKDMHGVKSEVYCAALQERLLVEGRLLWLGAGVGGSCQGVGGPWHAVASVLIG